MLLRLCLIVGFMGISCCGFCQCTDWEDLIYYKHVWLNDATKDRFGNTYVVGTFYEDVTIGTSTFTVPTGGNGAFIAKFDQNHSLVWAMSPTVTRWVSARQIEITGDGNIIVAGDFNWSISFNCLNFTVTKNPTWGNRDIFVLKLTPDGVPLWLTGSNSSDDCQVQRITMSPNGNCILIGNFVEKSFATPYLTAPDIEMGGVPVVTGAADQLHAGWDSFVSSIDPDGTVVWTQGIGGNDGGFDYTIDVTTDSKSNIIATGYFSSAQISINGHLLYGITLTNNYFVAKFDAEGQTLWVRGTESAIISQKGIGIDTDNDDNIFVTGEYDGDAKFGSFVLPGQGDDDVFIVKLDPEGITINATYVGGNSLDGGTALEVNSAGDVIVAGYYHSIDLEVGAFSSSNLEESGTDPFLATFSNDLATVKCAKFITGVGDGNIWDIEIDAFDEVSVMIELSRLYTTDEYEFKLDTHIFSDPDYSTAIVFIRNNSTPPSGTPDPFSLKAHLGKDTTLCAGQKLVLSVPSYCNAAYEWSTGETRNWIEVVTPGQYWIDVTLNGYTARGQVTVSYLEPIAVTLADDESICAGETRVLTLPVYPATTYTWNDGTTLNHNTVTGPGAYWVEVSNRCESIRETITLHQKAPANIQLVDEIITCEKEVMLSHVLEPGHNLSWSDGSTAPSLLVTQSGLYKLTVNNGCEETTQEVQVTIKAPEDFVIPNVVTFNADGKNDRFILPSSTGTWYSLTIVNRWGQNVFFASEYQNNWPSENHSDGVYFYTVRGECISAINGIIHLIR